MPRLTALLLASFGLLGAGIARDTTTPARNPTGAMPPATASSTTAASDIPTTGVRSIKMPVIQTDLPNGPGKATVMSTCTICHTQRYVLMQPAFPRKTWIAEVEKMKKAYGAPVLDEQVEPIVNYLVSIRGNGQ